MKETIFRVWCEFELNGKKQTSMVGPESWFLITQTGQLWFNSPLEPPRPIGKEYTKTVVMLCTGLKDKNGKQIYDGDIIKSTINGESDQWVIDMSNLSWFISPKGHAFDNSWIQFEIIGNTHENPELLKS